MRNKHTLGWPRAGVAGALATLAGTVGAQENPPGQIDYGPAAVSAVPTLGEWALVALLLALMALAYRQLRGRVNGRVLSSLLVVGATAVLALSGSPLMRVAQAILMDVSLNQAGGGTVDVRAGVSKLTNTSGVTQTIRAMRVLLPGYQWLEYPGYPQCVVGLVLAPGASCHVVLEYPAG